MAESLQGAECLRQVDMDRQNGGRQPDDAAQGSNAGRGPAGRGTQNLSVNTFTVDRPVDSRPACTEEPSGARCVLVRFICRLCLFLGAPVPEVT